MFRIHFEQGCRYVAKRFYEKALAVDFDSFLNASRHERTSRRRGYRNGHRSRNLLTTVGDLDIRVPRDREGQYQPGLFEWYQRVDRSLEETVWAMFLQGVSTRKVGDVLEALCSGRLSASKVSTVVKELDLPVRDFANHRIEDNFVFLFLDALSVSIRFELSAKKVKLLVALGSALMAARSCWGFR